MHCSIEGSAAGPPIRSIEVGTAVARISGCGGAADAVDIVRRLLEAGARPEDYATAASALGRVQRWGAALQLLPELRRVGVESRIESLNS